MVSPALTMSDSFVLESMRNLGQTGTHRMAGHLPSQLGPSPWSPTRQGWRWQRIGAETPGAGSLKEMEREPGRGPGMKSLELMEGCWWERAGAREGLPSGRGPGLRLVGHGSGQVTQLFSSAGEGTPDPRRESLRPRGAVVGARTRV